MLRRRAARERRFRLAGLIGGAFGGERAARVAVDSVAEPGRSADLPGPRVATAAGLAPRGRCRILRGVDGDTVAHACGGRGAVKGRLTGYDAPETHCQGCDAEQRLGSEAPARLATAIARAPLLIVEDGKVDRYGRLLAQPVWPEGTAAERFIAAGVAVSDDGGARIDRCTRLAARTR